MGVPVLGDLDPQPRFDSVFWQGFENMEREGIMNKTEATQLVTDLVSGKLSPQEAVERIGNSFADLKADRLTYCAYCGEEFPIDAERTPMAVSEHIQNCPKHPIQDYKAEIARLKKELAKQWQLHQEEIATLEGLHEANLKQERQKVAEEIFREYERLCFPEGVDGWEINDDDWQKLKARYKEAQ